MGKGTVGYQYQVPGTCTGTGSNVNGAQPSAKALEGLQVIVEKYPEYFNIEKATYSDWAYMIREVREILEVQVVLEGQDAHRNQSPVFLVGPGVQEGP